MTAADTKHAGASIGAKITLAVFGLFTLAGLAVLAQGLRMQGVDEVWGATLMKWGGGIAAIFAIPLFLPAKLRANLSISLVAVVLSIFAFNIYLAYTPPPENKAAAVVDEVRRNTPGFDMRTKRQVLLDLRKAGVDAYPALYGLHRLDDDAPPTELFPLTGIATSTVVGCNESGKFMIYESDEHGFNNPKDRPEEVDVVIVGDSFVQGQCVPRGSEVTGWLRKKGYRVYSVGAGGNGPLLNLAGLMEYGLPLKPKIVIWGYAGNDPNDLRSEQLNPTLRRYLEDPEFTQNLLERQDEIDAYWKDLVARKKLLEPDPAKLVAKTWKAPDPTLKELATLYSLRRLLGLRRSKQGNWRKLFVDILKEAKARSEAQGAKMYFLPFPYFELVESPPPNPRKIFGIAAPSGVEAIDVDTTFFEHPDRLSLFPLRMSGHCNDKGYSVVADRIEEVALIPNNIPKATD